MIIRQNSPIRRICSDIRRLWIDRRGSVTIIAAFVVVAASGLIGLVTQEALIYRAQRALQSSTALAALAAAQDIPSGTPLATAASYAALNTINGQTVTASSGYPVLKCLQSTGLSCSGPNAANAIVVKQQMTMPLMFGKLFGMSSTTIAATATAGAQGGGGGTAYDVIMILDTTRSMTNSDTSCSVKGATQFTCATAGARTLLQLFDPTLVQVGLMVFPGLTGTSQAAYDYDCATSPSPAVAKYGATPAPTYQIVGLSSDYKTSSTATSLNTGSNLVRAVQGGASNCNEGIDVVGGVGTFYADAITAAQTALTTNGRTGVQKVIILLSDGDANATSGNISSSKVNNQCHEGITAAQAATAAGTWVYTAAYGAITSSSSSCTTDSPAISACSAMQQMASVPANFFADTMSGTGSSTTCTSTVNGSSDIVGIFSGIGTSLTSARPRA
jgi:hypothetical protein